MTEAEWLACDDPGQVLDAVVVAIRGRKLRLFACACCRTVWDLLPDPESEEAVEVAERYADGQASETQLAAALDAVMRAVMSAPHPLYFAAVAACEEVSFPSARATSEYAIQAAARWEAPQAGGTAASWREAGLASARLRLAPAHASLLRDILGYPFLRIAFSPEWRTRPVLAIAQATYGERSLPSGHLDPARLAVLSDALEEAGCTSTDLLAHLRRPGPHVRGCWAVDLILGKE